ncbi:efflux RND transporter periplasmic adaptor subunit [Aeoliella sp. ICT_H6.2]|uniref:Efflux RND transporter periplasmic adaptor subunit n=2 Tax=Aeoliella straminimaris TaxID=2954799 RepID=A0A9X2JGL6_9BACT|nr:efflux RND transporter periplasmic adaptor subunit [Aeoliella straminimaris]
MKLPFAKLALALGLCCLSEFAMAQGRGPAPVVVAKVKQQPITYVQTFVGTVMPSQRATIGSAVDGRVIECNIEEGDRVEAGDALAQLLTETIRLEVKSAKSELQYLQAKLEELENGTRPEQIEQARAKMAAAKARSDYRVERRERLRDLAERSTAVTEDEWREALMAAAEAQELYAEATAVYDEAQAGPRKEAIAQAKAQVEMQQAVVNRLEDQLTKHTISSRFAGYVVTKNTEAGSWVNRGDVVAEVVGVDTVEVVVQVLEQGVPYVTRGREDKTVTVRVPALSQTESEGKFDGTVLAVVPQGDVRARTFPVKVSIPNQSTELGPLIKPGMYAEVDLAMGTSPQAMLVPKDAIVLNQKKKAVFVVDNGIANPFPLTQVREYGECLEIWGDVLPGQLVVVEGNERLRPGAQVSVIETREFEVPSTNAGTSP